jgi:hypothetical protein
MRELLKYIYNIKSICLEFRVRNSLIKNDASQSFGNQSSHFKVTELFFFIEILAYSIRFVVNLQALSIWLKPVLL